MKNGTPLLKTLLVAAAAMSFCATTVWANDVTLTEDATTIYPSLSSTTATVGVANYVISDDSNSGWMFVVQSSSTAPMQSYTTITFETGTTFSGTGLFGIYFQQGFANTTETVDLTNVDASSLSGQLSVENAYNNVTIVKVKGDTWSNVEYLFGDAEGSHHGTSGDTLTLTDSTTFAGISGTTAGTGETITVETASASLTLAGSGEYGFYGALGTSSTRASLAMTGEGKQTFGGTNYLQDVSVTAGTLALGGTTDISGTVSVGAGATLDLSGTITLGSAISNAGSITIADETCFVLDNLTQTYDPDRRYGYCQLIEGSGGTLSYTEGSISFSFDGSTIDWSIYVDDSGNVYAYGTVGELTWAGDSTSNTWNYTDTNWIVEGSTTKTTFSEGNDATFGTIGDDSYGTVNITTDIKAGSITVEDNYTFVLSNGVTLEADYIDVVAKEGEGNYTLKLQVASSGDTALVQMDGEDFVNFFGNTSAQENHGTVEIGEGVTFYLTDSTQSASIGSGNYGAVVTGTGTLSIKATSVGLYLPDFQGTVEFREGTEARIGIDNDSYGDVGIFGDGATLVFQKGSGISIVGDLSSWTTTEDAKVTAALVFEEGSHTIATNGHTAEFSGTISGEKADITISGKGNLTFSGGSISLGSLTLSGASTVTFTQGAAITGAITYTGAATVAIADGATLTAGSVTDDTSSAAHITLGEGSTLNVTGTMAFGTASASTIFSEINGAGADKSTVIVNSLMIGDSHGGASTQVNDVTLIVGSISTNGASSTTKNLYLKDVTLGFTGDATVSGVGLYLGTHDGDTWGGTTSDASTTTINTSKYDVDSGVFSTTEGVDATISSAIRGSGTLVVEGLGKLTLSGSAELGALTLSSGALEISGTTTAGGLTVSAGTLSVSEDATLNLSGTISLATSIENSGTITIAEDTSFVIDGIEMSTKGNDGTNYYVIIDGSSGTGSVSFSGSISDFTLSSGESLGGWSVYVDDGYLVIHNGVPPQELIWAGTDNGHEWNATQSNTIWTNADGESVAFSTDSNVTFDDTAENKSVVLGDNIEAGTITVTGTGYELSGEYELTATEFVLADTNEGEHTFTIAKGTTVEVGSFTENVGQMNLVVNGDLKVDGDMHVDASADEVISGSGTFYVRDFTYDAAQGSSLTISVADASFTTLYEQPSSGSDDSNGDYRRLIIGSEDGAIPDGKDYSTEVWVGDGLTLAGKSELRVNENSYLYTTSLTDSSDYDTLISGEGYLEAAYVTFGGKGEVTISIATFDVGNITFSNEGKLTISSDCFWAYTAVFSNSGEITITSGANVFIGETTSTVNHTITVEEDATFTVGSLDRTQNKLDLVVNGEMNVVKDLSFGEYEENTSGLLSFGDSTDDSRTSYEQTLSGTGTVNVYGIEDNLSTGKVTISVANLNIGDGGITEYGNSGIHLAGTTIGLYNTEKLTLSVPLTIDSAGATFKTDEGEELTLSGAITGNGMVTKTGEGDLILAGTGSTLTNGLTVSAGTLSVAADASLTLGGTIDLSSAIQNSGLITIAEGASIVVGVEKQSGEYNGTNYDYYELITGSESASVTLNGSVIFTIGDESITLNSLLQRYADSDTWNIYSEGGYLVIYEATSDEKPANIYWAGSDGNSTIWVADDDSIIDWSGSDGGEAVYSFADGDAVIFGTAAESKTVAVSGTVAPGSITINGDYTFNKDEGAESALVQTSELTFGDGGKLTIGDDVTVQIVGNEPLSGFSVDGTIVGTGTLQLELTADNNYSATVNLGTQNEFAGTVYITAGNFTLNGSDIGNGTYRLGDGVNMQVTSSGVEVGNNFILEGTSQVHVNANDSLTINGNVTGVAAEDGTMGGTFDRQGAGALTINGDVDIGTFIIDTSGSEATSSTTFSGESVTIGTLDVTYADSVVFSGGDESSLNIGKLTFEAAGVIEFQNGGTIGTISYDKQSSSGIIRVSGGTLEVGTITNTYTDVQTGNETLTKIQVGADAVLHAETITIAPGNAGSVYSTISGIEDGGAGTVIADTFTIGSSGGGSVEVSDVTLIVGSLNYAAVGSSQLNLYLKDATLGFTGDTEIKSTEGSGSTSRFVLGGFASGNSSETGSGTTTTINTSKYVVDSTTGAGAFSTTEGVTVTISQIISGQGALVVDGVGKLILSAENTYSGNTTIKEGATVVVQNKSALGTGSTTGSVSVESGATLELDTALATASTVTFTSGASIVLGGDLLQEIIASVDTGYAVAVITANDISFGDEMASNYTDNDDGLTDIVNQYVTSNPYGITWSWSDGTLWAVATIPEPSMFGLFFGLGALGLVATRRRRRRQYREAA